MQYLDQVYGKVKVTEPVILELINSPSLKRLKGVDQGGYQKLFAKPKIKISGYEHSRFNHSLGVYLLLRKFNTSLEEQIAGLIHDVSHSVFSHCIDYVFSQLSEKYHDHQDRIFKNFVGKTTIPKILKKHGLEPAYILNESNFPLKEKPLPDLCADRIDYCLREALIFEEINKKQNKYFLDNLMVKNKNWVFKNFKSAKKFAQLFYLMNTKYYSGLISAIMFRTVGDYLKYSLEKSYIQKKDLYTTDKEVLDKIKKFHHRDQKLKILFARMNDRQLTTNNPDHYDAKVFCKSRAVDPLCQHQGKIKRLSELNKNWQKILEKETKPKQYFLKFQE